jgi:hypothetical protein
MSSTQNFQQDVMAELAALRAENAEMKIMLKTVMAEPPSAIKTKTKKTKTPKADAEPKEKKEGTPWSIFSGRRVGGLIRASETAFPKEEKSGVAVILQFASVLKGKKAYDEWTDEDIMAEWATFEAPAVSKKELERQSKSSTGSAEASEPVADDADAPKEKKARKPQSEETKAAAAAKRAATLAAKKAAAPPAEEAEEAAPAPAPKPAEKPAEKPKAKIAAKPKKVDLFLDPWTHDGKGYLKNERNDVVSEDGEWVGRWTGSAIDTSAPEPLDFETLTTRD